MNNGTKYIENTLTIRSRSRSITATPSEIIYAVTNLESSEKRVKEFELLVANLIPLFESGYIANHSAKADKDRERLLKIMKTLTTP